MSESEQLPGDGSQAEGLGAEQTAAEQLASEAPIDPKGTGTGGPEPVPSLHSPAELSRALQAFKKRLKLTQLDSESKMGYGPMTGGRPSGIVAITPPNQYPRSVWDALVAQGRLKKGSQGMYELG